MKPADILKMVEFLHKDKEIEREIIFDILEGALLLAAKDRLGDRPLGVKIDRISGELSVTDEYGDELDPTEFGRIAAQKAKQQIIQRLRELERENIFVEYEQRLEDIVVGTILRYEGPNLIVNLGKTEGFLPKKEQVREERYQVGDRVRVYIKEVRRDKSRVRILLSRTHKDFIRRLFELEVPEIGQGLIKIEEIVREPGYRTKIAVSSTNDRVDAVGACVGVRGTRIKNIIDELSGEKIDIIRWDENPAQLIKNALKPAEVFDVVLDHEAVRARALVPNNHQSLAIGKRGLNVRLASRLAGWEIDILNERQMLEERDNRIRHLSSLPHITADMADTLYTRGYETLEDLLELGPERLAKLDGLDEGRAAEVIEVIDQLLTEVLSESSESVEATTAAAAAADGETTGAPAAGEGAAGQAAPEAGEAAGGAEASEPTAEVDAADDEGETEAAEEDAAATGPPEEIEATEEKREEVASEPPASQ